MNNTERLRAAEWFRNTDFSTGARRCHSPPYSCAFTGFSPWLFTELVSPGTD